MKNEAIGKFKPSDVMIVLCISWKYAKTRFNCIIKSENQLPLYHILQAKQIQLANTKSFNNDPISFKLAL